MIHTYKSPDDKHAITFEMGFASIVTGATARQLVQVIRQHHPAQLAADPLLIPVVDYMAKMISTTKRITFHLDESSATDSLTAFRAFWVWFWDNVVLKSETPGAVRLVDNPPLLAEIWTRFQSAVSDDLQAEWWQAYEMGNTTFPAPAVLKPLAEIEPGLRQDPDFLAQGAPPENH